MVPALRGGRVFCGTILCVPPSDPSRHLSRHVTAGGVRIYSLSVWAFMHLRVNVFLVLAGDPAAPSYSALIDMGSHEEQSQADLLAGLAAVRDVYGEHWSWDSLSRLIVTHPHPDHAGGLPLVRSLTAAPLAAHAWGLELIQDPEAARLAALPDNLKYVEWIGATGQYAERLSRRAEKTWLPAGVPVQTVLHGGETLDGLFEVIHTAGHEGAQVCLRLHDLLLTADHLLPRNSPPLAPAWLRRGGGLENYLQALDKIEPLEGVRLALGSHDEPMPHWKERIQAVRARYEGKLSALLEVASEPLTVQELTLRLYPRLPDAQAILLLDQTAALAEYLAQQGRLQEVVGLPARFVRAS